MVRAALAGLVDFSRIIVMRSASDFDRPPPGLTAYDNLFTDVGGFLPALANLYNVGVLIIQGVIKNWDSTFDAGIPGKYFSYGSSIVHRVDRTDSSSAKLHWGYIWIIRWHP